MIKPKIGGKYNWQYQPERLVYLGKMGVWHQFAKVESPSIVWCEVDHDQLEQFEETMVHVAAGELDALRKDAERMRWVKMNPTWLGWDADYRPDEVERVVDEAMANSLAPWKKRS